MKNSLSYSALLSLTVLVSCDSPPELSPGLAGDAEPYILILQVLESQLASRNAPDPIAFVMRHQVLAGNSLMAIPEAVFDYLPACRPCYDQPWVEGRFAIFGELTPIDDRTFDIHVHTGPGMSAYRHFRATHVVSTGWAVEDRITIIADALPMGCCPD